MIRLAFPASMRTDRLLPAHHVRVCRPFMPWLVSAAMLLIAVATVAVSVAQVRAERERITAWLASKDVAESRITIVYQDDGVVCSVPPGRERAAAVVFQGCNALAGALKAAGVGK